VLRCAIGKYLECYLRSKYNYQDCLPCRAPTLTAIPFPEKVRFAMIASHRILIAACAVGFAGQIAAVKFSTRLSPYCYQGILCREFHYLRGHAYSYPLAVPFARPDRDEDLGSTLGVFEDGVPLGPAHSDVRDIASLGGGRFVYWQSGMFTTLYISASDNSDPNTNGKTYTVSDPKIVDPYLRAKPEP
jgi:hypothetical protein